MTAKKVRYRFSATLSLISALDEGGWLKPHPGLFIPRNDTLPIVWEVELAPRPVWTGAQNLAPTAFDPRTVQPVARRYTDHAIPAHDPTNYVTDIQWAWISVFKVTLTIIPFLDCLINWYSIHIPLGIECSVSCSS